MSAELATGRRRSRRGAVPVAELLRRQPLSPEGIDYQQEFADGLLASAVLPGDEPLSPIGRRTMCVLAALLMCASAAAASMIIASPPPATPRQAVTEAGRIHGPDALRPDLLVQARWPFANNGGYAIPRSAGNTEDLLPPEAPRPSQLTAANPAAGSSGSGIQLVREFYDLLGKDTVRASGLLAPSLIETERDELAKAWEDFAEIVPRQITMTPQGLVKAEVTAVRRDGTSVAFRHLFTVSSGSEPAIIDVQLLAARYSRPPGQPPP